MANRLDEGIVLTISAAPLELAGGPLRLLLRLRQLAGHSRRLVTYTKSLASLFSKCTNTIRAWRDQLIDAGYIHWVTNQRTGMSTIYITELVEPPSRRNQIEEQRRIDILPNPLPWQKPKPMVLKSDPKPWWKYPTKSGFCLGGAQSSALIKSSKKLASAGSTVG